MKLCKEKQWKVMEASHTLVGIGSGRSDVSGDQNMIQDRALIVFLCNLFFSLTPIVLLSTQLIVDVVGAL